MLRFLSLLSIRLLGRVLMPAKLVCGFLHGFFIALICNAKFLHADCDNGN